MKDAKDAETFEDAKRNISKTIAASASEEPTNNN
jgi:hypothetical protein